MKYLRKFNESKLGDELKDFCQEYLAFLTDDKFECYVNSNDVNTHITILDRDPVDGRGREFYWSEIEDDFIPFLQILSERYIIAYNRIILTGYMQYNKGFSIKNVIDGKIPEYTTCNSVSLQIDKKID
jgi:hypothetical protein